MNKQTKTAQLEARQAEAIKTATEAEKAARNALIKSYKRFSIFGHTFELSSKKALHKYEQAQEKRLNLIRQYGAILQAVCIDYTETNSMRTN